jgi:peroxiredoxin Q/BCP
MLTVGARAPGFSLASDGGSTVALKDLKGRRVVLYFYPKDDTSGCTTEACEFRDRWKEVERLGVVVLGVSPDPLASHLKFKQKYRLPFPLLSDPDHAVADAYGAWGPKSMYGRTYEGIRRSTFLIDEDGKILRIFRNVKPKGHAAEVLEALEAESGSSP